MQPRPRRFASHEHVLCALVQVAWARLASLCVLLFTTMCAFFYYTVPGTAIADLDSGLSRALQVGPCTG